MPGADDVDRCCERLFNIAIRTRHGAKIQLRSGGRMMNSVDIRHTFLSR